MKDLIVLAAVLLVGCAETRTLEELELLAIQSGDWSAVENREKAIARRAKQRGPSCASGAIAVCDTLGGQPKCVCSSREDMYDFLNDL